MTRWLQHEPSNRNTNHVSYNYSGRCRMGNIKGIIIMGFLFWKKPIEAAADIVKDVASTGMGIWDNSEFTAQERMVKYLEHLNAVKDMATSIGRRMLLVVVTSFAALTLGLALVYNHFGMVDEYNGVVRIAEDWKVGWAWVGANAFYFGTHLVKGISGK